MTHQEAVLLIEGSGQNQRLRVYVTRDPMLHTIVERSHLADGTIQERIWLHQHGERALTGQRIFRPPPCPPVQEARERPLFDETHVRLVLPDEPGYRDLQKKGWSR